MMKNLLVMQKPLFFCCRFAPGIGLCLIITLISHALHDWGQQQLGRFAPDTLVLAILIGTALRSTMKTCLDKGYFDPGIGFSGRFLLELAVMGFGASISMEILVRSGLVIISAVLLLVASSIVISYTLSRWLGLPSNLALLIACGNSICGNSAIAAVACVIKAKSDEIAPAIAFTALLGMVVVVILPFLIPLLALSDHQYGVFAGMTVYAVPQVLAATLPVSVAASHSGMIVKLIRVLMLGPLILVISLFANSGYGEGRQIRWCQLVPWFIIGFALMMALRSAHLIPLSLLEPIEQMARFLTILSMAALGLGVDVRSLAKAGGKVVLAATISLVALGGQAAIFCLFFI